MPFLSVDGDLESIPIGQPERVVFIFCAAAQTRRVRVTDGYREDHLLRAIDATL